MKWVAFAVVGTAFVISTAVVILKLPGMMMHGGAGAMNSMTANLVTQGGRIVNGAGRLGSRLAEAFLAEHIDRTFSDHLTSIEADEKGRLLVAKIEAEERTSIKDQKWWGDTTVEIKVPAVFLYGVSLKEKWTVHTESTPTSTICYVVCPYIRPILPVAFDTLGMESKTTTTWLRLDGDEHAFELTREITPFLTKRSGELARQARDKARQAIAEFVRGWLLDRGQWGDGKFQRVIVNFPDEVDANGNPLPVKKPRPD